MFLLFDVEEEFLNKILGIPVEAKAGVANLDEVLILTDFMAGEQFHHFVVNLDLGRGESNRSNSLGLTNIYQTITRNFLLINPVVRISLTLLTHNLMVGFAISRVKIVQK